LLAWSLLVIVIGAGFVPSASSDTQENNSLAKITYVENGKFSKELDLPVYEWYREDKPTIGLILAIHGLTLHGTSYSVLARVLADRGFYVCACDMHGFGQCYANKISGKKNIDYADSYQDIEKLAALMKQTHPGLPLYALGESLGTCMCIRLAANRPDLVDGLILSGPTAQVHPLMFVHPKIISAGTVGYFMEPRFQVNTDAFAKYLVSNDKRVAQEMLDDPLVRKGLTIKDLLKTDSFVSKTFSYARKMKRDEPVLVLQGSEDRCMVPSAITKLSKKIPSADQTLFWLNDHGHLLLETSYLRPTTMNALINWLDLHDNSSSENAKIMEEELLRLGAKPSEDKL
jgi:alpha-beta hydrolase superfamily lysophospholipase